MKKVLLFITASLLMFSTMSFAASLSEKHFRGGQNLNAGQQRGSDKHLAQILNLKLDTANMIVLTSAAGSGGAATEAMTVTGLQVGDVILSVTQSTAGAANLPLLGWSTPIANGITGVWSANPLAGAIIKVLIRRP